MGLLELLQQGQTQLSAGSYPGDVPINDPQSGFIQENSPINTYNDETIGQPDNGSLLSSSLVNTALDNTEGEFTTNTLPPQSNQYYPWMASGQFGYGASQFTSPYSPVGNGVYGYLGDNNQSEINNPDTNPQILTLSETSLNPNNNNYSAIVNPLSIQTNYPVFARGKWRGSALQFSQIWSSNSIYIENYNPFTQTQTLSYTSLDNYNPESQNTTYPIPNANSYPNGYVTLDYLPPQVGMGMFGFGPGQYNSNYSWNGGYYSQINYNNIITTSDNPLVNYTPVSGLSIDNNGVAAFVQSYPFNQTYLGDPGFPEFVTGNWGNGPYLFNQYYTPNYNYLEEVTNFGGYHNVEELNKTSLDNTSPNNWGGVIPNNISAPTDYPLLVTGEFNAAPTQYESQYNINNTYLDNISIQSEVSPQHSSLVQTGLDNDYTPHEPTTITPNNITYPNDYPALQYVNMGEFNGPPSQYNTPYSAISSYLSQYNTLIDTNTNPQLLSLVDTGLDVEYSEAAPTTYEVPQVDNITLYPANNVTGVTGSAPQPFNQMWLPTKEYYSFMKTQYQAH